MLGMATIVAFHAHPDDEVLLTGGTLALLASEGHRTVIVVACDRVMEEAVGEGATLRLDELLRHSRRALEIQRSFASGARTGVRMTSRPSAPKTASKAARKLLPRSWIRKQGLISPLAAPRPGSAPAGQPSPRPGARRRH
jgi:LmbE family N-acetylglucosaminyl deacetylase